MAQAKKKVAAEIEVDGVRYTREGSKVAGGVCANPMPPTQANRDNSWVSGHTDS